MNHALVDFNAKYKHSRLPIEIPIQALWAQSALWLLYAIKNPKVHGLLVANCYFLLQSGVLKSLGEAQENVATEGISTILHMSIIAYDHRVFSF